ncbi:hypothetical protein [Chishuiella sp.]|uniref:hypothetical protein n=1 Tax=Chishuiella sp. TaxID=1969467 RepID=UPI0028ABD4A0|nr:hypothetical protein [Chishuiella sp.]
MLFILVFGCKGKQMKNMTLFEEKKLENNDTLKLIKDTVIFEGSTEGEDVKLFVNKKNNDSVIISIVYGETGKAKYKFVFNGKLNNGEREMFFYKQSITQNSNADVKNTIIENLNTSEEVKNELYDIYIYLIAKIFNSKLSKRIEIVKII